MIEKDFHTKLRLNKFIQTKGNYKLIAGLNKNETLSAKIICMEKDGSAQLLIKGEKVNVRTHLRLVPGTTIQLKVEKMYPAVTLKLTGYIPNETEKANLSAILSAIKEKLWIWPNEKIKQLNLHEKEKAILKQIINDLTYKTFFKNSSEIFKTIINKSGLCWEAKLKKELHRKNITTNQINLLMENDLKGVLINILNSKEIKEKPIMRLFLALKNIQLLNRKYVKKEGKIFIPIPIQYPDGFCTIGQLLIKISGEEKESQKTNNDDTPKCKVVFSIDMSKIGPIRAELDLQGKKVDGRIFVSGKRTKALIENKILSFIQKLEDREFVVNTIKCVSQDLKTINHSLINENYQENNSSICLIG